jgi:co-chaperonin GroES (HSP10)
MIVDETNFFPLRSLILVRRDDPETFKDGIIIPDNVKEYGWRATVIRSGPDATKYVKGDTILFLKEFTVLPFKDRTLAITDAKHILAKLEVVKNVELIVPQNRFVLIKPDVVSKKIDAIYLSDKSKLPPKTGCIVRCSAECRETKAGFFVWFEPNFGVNCVENGVLHKLLDEDNILAMEVE